MHRLSYPAVHFFSLTISPGHPSRTREVQSILFNSYIVVQARKYHYLVRITLLMNNQGFFFSFSPLQTMLLYKYPWAYNLTNGAFISKHRFPSSEIAGSKINSLFSYILAGYSNESVFSTKATKICVRSLDWGFRGHMQNRSPQEIQEQPEESPQGQEREVLAPWGKSTEVSIQTWALSDLGRDRGAGVGGGGGVAGVGRECPPHLVAYQNKFSSFWWKHQIFFGETIPCLPLWQVPSNSGSWDELLT